MKREARRLKLSLSNAHYELRSPRNEDRRNGTQPEDGNTAKTFGFKDEEFESLPGTVQIEEDHMSTPETLSK